jgi:hypothetical protein
VIAGTSRTSNSSAAETARKAWIINRGPRPRSRVRSPSESVSARPRHVMTVRHRGRLGQVHPEVHDVWASFYRLPRAIKL